MNDFLELHKDTEDGTFEPDCYYNGNNCLKDGWN